MSLLLDERPREPSVGSLRGDMRTGAKTMTRAPYGLPVIESCLQCPGEGDRPFCDHLGPIRAALDAISTSATYPKDAILFVQGQEPRGVFIMCNGRAKLSVTAADGKTIIVRVTQPGELIGLPGTIAGKPYELTAEAMEPLQARFIPRDLFLRFLRENPGAALHVLEMMSCIFRATLMEIRFLGLSASAAQKLAHFVLDLPDVEPRAPGPARKKLTMTHKEIAERLGTSRETVTRTFASFRRDGLLELHGSSLQILDPVGLQELV